MSEVATVSVALRLGWLTVVSVAVLASDPGDYRLFGLFSLSALFVGAAAVASAFRTAREWPGGTERRRVALFTSTSDPATGAGWSWARLADVYEVVSVGIVSWLATALVVGVAVEVATGTGTSWVVRGFIGMVTAPVVVVWPMRRWPPASTRGSGWAIALVKRRLVLSVLFCAGVSVLAAAVDRLVSESWSLALTRQLARIAAIVLVVSSTAWLGYHLPGSRPVARRESWKPA